MEGLKLLQHKLRSSRTMILVILVFLDMRCLIDDLPGSFKEEANFTWEKQQQNILKMTKSHISGSWVCKKESDTVAFSWSKVSNQLSYS